MSLFRLSSARLTRSDKGFHAARDLQVNLTDARETLAWVQSSAGAAMCQDIPWLEVNLACHIATLRNLLRLRIALEAMAGFRVVPSSPTPDLWDVYPFLPDPTA